MDPYRSQSAYHAALGLDSLLESHQDDMCYPLVALAQSGQPTSPSLRLPRKFPRGKETLRLLLRSAKSSRTAPRGRRFEVG